MKERIPHFLPRRPMEPVIPLRKSSKVEELHWLITCIDIGVDG
jgi:hypothetical protein